MGKIYSVTVNDTVRSEDNVAKGGTFHTVILNEYLWPLINLLKELDKRHSLKLANGKKSIQENGYSLVIILSFVTLFESYINYRRLNDTTISTENREAIKQIFPNQKAIITELYALRDSIAHAHIWKVTGDFIDEEDYNTFIPRIVSKLEEYGNKTFSSVIDIPTGKSKILNLWVIPTNIGYTEAVATFIIVSSLISKNNPEIIDTIVYDRVKVRDYLQEKILEFPNITKALGIDPF